MGYKDWKVEINRVVPTIERSGWDARPNLVQRTDNTYEIDAQDKIDTVEIIPRLTNVSSAYSDQKIANIRDDYTEMKYQIYEETEWGGKSFINPSTPGWGKATPVREDTLPIEDWSLADDKTYNISYWYTIDGFSASNSTIKMAFRYTVVSGSQIL